MQWCWAYLAQQSLAVIPLARLSAPLVPVFVKVKSPHLSDAWGPGLLRVAINVYAAFVLDLNVML